MVIIDFHTHRPTAEGVVSPRSFGIHPWRAAAEECLTFETFREKYIKQFGEAEIVGECGLDKACNVDWATQVRLFDWQTRIAAELHKPVVVHCVRAYNEVMEMHRGNDGGKWVVHGFGGTAQLAEQLFRDGILVSYGAALLDSRRQKVRDSLMENPYPFLLETDISEISIEEIYRIAAEIKKMSMEELAGTIKETYETLFSNKL